MFNIKLPFVRYKLIALFFLAPLAALDACASTSLEEQFNGIEACQIKNIFLDPVTKEASGQYFSERKLEPCRIDEVAFYCVSDTFMAWP
ncbi:hypothetical protein K5D56_23440 [Pseudomonas cichorii]|nr:hypothetical protein [Pseudomonas cichorii]